VILEEVKENETIASRLRNRRRRRKARRKY